jgi:hypothetical protein
MNADELVLCAFSSAHPEEELRLADGRRMLVFAVAAGFLQKYIEPSPSSPEIAPHRTRTEIVTL